MGGTNLLAKNVKIPKANIDELIISNDKYKVCLTNIPKLIGKKKFSKVNMQ